MKRLNTINDFLYPRLIGAIGRNFEGNALYDFLVMLLGLMLLVSVLVGFVQMALGLNALVRTVEFIISTIIPA